MPDLLIAGLQFPRMLGVLVAGGVLQLLLDRVFARLGVYAWVWHPGLFRFAVLLALWVLAGRWLIA